MSKKFIAQLKRTHMCNFLSLSNQGKEVVLMGWVDCRRDHGGLVFIDLRDRSGLVQVVINPANPETAAAKNLRGEYVVALQGIVRPRPQGMTNNKLATGEIEVEATRLEVLSEAETPPFQISDQKVSETLRLKYRYLDLRSQHLQGYLVTRHRVMQLTRQKLSEMGFVEVETPILYKSTPEGARDYLVPSRVNQGHFYALPQSPQTLKQLLMIGGMDRYFQIARCFRDEDLRADRQPEFSQIDVEMSFVDQDDIMGATEDLLKLLWKEIKDVDIGKVPTMTFKEAMDRFGSDKPDLRIPWELKDLGDAVAGTGFKVFEDVLARKGSVKGLFVPGIADYSRSQLDKLTAIAKQMGAKGLVWIKWDNAGQVTSPISKFVDEARLKKIYETAGGKPGGLVLVVADDFYVTCAALTTLRSHLARELNAIDTSQDRFLWVTEFPLLEYSPDDKRWVARHHPFTSPMDDDMDALFKPDEADMGALRAKAYDLVCNGYEMAGGSVRIHNQKLQEAMFNTLGIGPEERQEKFGFFLEALRYGTPPHAGIAWGLDRLVMILVGTDAIRDVIAFPKTAKATDLMSGAPGLVMRDQLIELGIRLAPQAEQALAKEKELSQL